MLSKQEKILYTELVKEYNNTDYCKICGLDRFLKSKMNNEKRPVKHTMLYNIYWYNQNNY